MDAPELKADIERIGRESQVFEGRWKGTLPRRPKRARRANLGIALRDFEALEELIGRVASLCGAGLCRRYV